MANEYENAVKVNSKTFFTYEKKDSQGDGTGFYVDPLIEQALHSRTFLPPGTVVFAEKDEAKMLKEMAKKKYSFKASDLSDYTKVKFGEEKIKFEDDQGEDEQ